MKDKPLVSIIMGVYNCEETVRDSIESIISQSCQNWEFIICDDGSTDATYDICREYARKDRRFTVLRNRQNRKLEASLNRCLARAQGKYIARMDADDISLPLRLEKETGFLETHPHIAAVGCCCYITDGKNIVSKRRYKEYPQKKDLLLRTPYAHPAVCVRKEVYDRLQGYAEDKKIVRAQDLELWFRFYENGFTGYNLQEYLFQYRESFHDYKKRSLKSGMQTAGVFLKGYKRLHAPLCLYPLAFKPVLSAMLPDWFLYWFHNSGEYAR